MQFFPAESAPPFALPWSTRAFVQHITKFVFLFTRMRFFSVVFDTALALALCYGPYRTSDEPFDTVFDTVLALLLYHGPYRRLPRMMFSMWSSIVAVPALLLYYGPYQRLPRVRLPMWSSTLFLHCFCTMDLSKTGSDGGFRCGLRCRSCTASLLWWTLSKTTSDEAFDCL